MSTTEIISRYFVQTKYEDIPEQVVTLAKRYFKDWLAVAIGGYGVKPGKIITHFVVSQGGVPESTLIGSGFKTSVSNAALVNGTIGHLLDFDDSGPSHPTASILPTALALGEKLKSSGKDILLAQVLGYECFNRLYQAAREHESTLRKKGIHPTTLWGSCASAIVAAKLLKFDVKQTQMTIGLAATQAAGLMENFGTPTKGFHCGNLSRAGITAALLVQMGFNASQTILEGSHGFYSAFLGKGNYDLDRITKKLGKDWLLLSPGIDMKRYPSCAATLRAIESSIYLAKKHNIYPEQIKTIEVKINSTRRNFLRFDNPSCGDEAKFSMPYAVAISIIDRDVTLDSYSDEKVNSSAIRSLMKKVEMSIMDDNFDPEILKTTPIKIFLKNGDILEKNVIDYTGSAKNPMNEQDILNKFLYCASIPTPALSESQVIKCISFVDNLEKAPNILPLLSSLTIN